MTRTPNKQTVQKTWLHLWLGGGSSWLGLGMFRFGLHVQSLRTVASDPLVSDVS
jgi:hypothetical protein